MSDYSLPAASVIGFVLLAIASQQIGKYLTRWHLPLMSGFPGAGRWWDPALEGKLLRELRLPLDTLVLSVSRDGHMLVSHGYTRLTVGDHVTVIGSESSLEEVAVLFAK